jgi:hypothetical protein
MPLIIVAMAADVILGSFALGLPLKLGLVVLLVAAGLLLRQLNRWERQLLQGDGEAPRNRLR